MSARPPFPPEETDLESGDPLRRLPAPPLAKRLNRNALTVAAVLMGMTVLTAVIVFNPGNGPASDGPAQPNPSDAPPASRPAFLDNPTPGTPTGNASWSAPGADAPVPPPPPESTPAPDVAAGSAGWPSSGPTAAYPPSAATPTSFDAGPAQPALSARERAYRAALTSAVTVGQLPNEEGETRRLDGDPRADELSAAAWEPAEGGAVVHPATAGSASARSAGPARQVAVPGAGARGSGADGSAIIARLVPAAPYTLRAGTVIPAVLLTAINSELPGECVGQVSRNVYDSRTQRVLLIPRGAKLLCRYDNQVALSQNRLLVAWTRLVLPNDRSMTLPGLPLKDIQGQTGAAGQVDRHGRRVFGNALLLSALSAAVQLSQPRQGGAFAAPSAGQVAAGALGQELSEVTLEMVRRGMNVAPTITIPEGRPFLVFLNGDLVFDGPYVDEPVSAP